MAKQACSVDYTLSQANLLALIEENHFLQMVPLDQWTITSFNPKTREVCVTMINDVSTTRFTVTFKPFV